MMKLLGEHTGLPPVRIGHHPGQGKFCVWTLVEHQQREKLQKQWDKMDEDDCERQHYKHYEWVLRSALAELEAREEQLKKAIAFLTPEELEAICPQSTN
jgi:hypothetical protein